MKIILASGSPRRKELLSKLNVEYEAMPADSSEIIDKRLSLKKQVLSIAREKAVIVASETEHYGDRIVISADTMVAIKNKNLGKPEDKEQAKEFLNMLSDKWHNVITAMVVLEIKEGKHRSIYNIDSPKVKFKKLTDNEIEEYIASGEPMDKAGAYAVQGLGGRFVEKIKGNKNAIIGLNIKKLEKILKFKLKI